MMLQTIEFMEQQQVEVQERLRNQHATNQRYAVLLAQISQQVPVIPTPVTPPPVRRRAAPITPMPITPM
jgi:CRP-like cAMP-binding protein